MRQYLEELKDFPKKCDWVLLILLLIVSGFGCVCIASATSAEKFEGNIRYIILQLVAIGLGVVIFAMISSKVLFYYIIHFFSPSFNTFFEF